MTTSLRVSLMAAISAAFVFNGCAHSSHHDPSIKKGDFAGVGYRFRSKTYFTGEPTAEALTAAKAAGVTTVIDLRAPDEVKDSKFAGEDAAAKAAGLQYYNVPVPRDQEYDPNTFANVEEIYMKHHKAGEHVLVHCKSGARAASWFAYHLRHTHGDSSDEAFKTAAPLGYEGNSKISDKTRALLDKPAKLQ